MKEKEKDILNIAGKVMIVMGIILIVIGFYGLITGGFGNNYKQLYEETLENQTRDQIFLNGSIYGQQLAVLTILQQAQSCQPVAIPFQNQTFHLYLLECEGVGNG